MTDIMPLIEENRRLHDEVRVLKSALADQNVRVDEVLAANRYNPHFVSVEVDHAEVLGFTREKLLNVVSSRLAAELMPLIPKIAQTVKTSSVPAIRYDFAFLALNPSTTNVV